MIKDIVALLDGSTGDDLPLEHAAVLSRLFDANLTALYLNILPEVLISGNSSLSPVAIDHVTAKSKDVGAAAATLLAARVRALTVRGEVRHVDATDSELWNVVSNASRAADLFVLRHPGRAAARRQDREVAEAALFGFARGVYLAGSPAQSEPIFRSVVVAWDNSHSATRALTEALPFLEKADRTLVVTVDGAAAAEPTELAQDAISVDISHTSVWRPSTAESTLWAALSRR
jgi:hypothetical protein